MIKTSRTDLIAALHAAGYDTSETATGAVYITGWECESDADWDQARADVLAVIAPIGGTAEWVDDDLHIGIRGETYPADVAREVSIRRPDLAAHDAIAAVLTADPTLSADDVIETLDKAAADYARDIAAEQE